jgi:large subunit ribosomal protein L35
MPKMKTHSASKKRFRKNNKGTKIKRSKAYKRHHAWSKTPGQGRKLRKSTHLEGTQHKNMETLLPY